MSITKTRREARARHVSLCAEISQSVQMLIRFLRDRHGEAAELHEKLVPEAYWVDQRRCEVQCEEIPRIFLERLLAKDLRVWMCFIMNFQGLIDLERIAKQSDLEMLLSLSPCPEHHPCRVAMSSSSELA